MHPLERISLQAARMLCIVVRLFNVVLVVIVIVASDVFCIILEIKIEVCL